MGNRNRVNFIIQDLGMLVFLASIFVSSFIVSNSDAELKMENVIMFLVLILSIILVSFQITTLAVVCAGLQVLMYSAYKLYLNYSQGISVQLLSYAWLFLPLLAVGSMLLFLQGRLRTELENEVLKQQVEDLVMIEPLTGLYNFRSMYNDLERQIAYSYRNSLDLSLMIVKLRYESELKKILSSRNYDALIQKLASILEDCIRLEDKIYAIDNKGSVALMLTCDSEGAAIVRQRINNSLNAKDAFARITDAPIKVETRSAYVQYNKDEGRISAMELVQKVESELQYDV